MIVSGGAGIAKDLYVGDVAYVQSTAEATDASSGALIVSGGAGIAKDLYVGDVAYVQSTAEATDASSGALIVSGGVGIAKNLYVDGDMFNMNSKLIVDSIADLTTMDTDQLKIHDNIVCNNESSSILEDGGYASRRKATEIELNDTAKWSLNVFTEYVGSSTTLIIEDKAWNQMNDYFNGWYVSDGTTTVRIVDDVHAVGNHTLTLESKLSDSKITVGTAMSLYNKSNIGWIWDESKNNLSAYWFPRDNLAVLDPDAVDGSAPEYANVSVQDLNVKGDLKVEGGISIPPNPVQALVLTNETAHTITVDELKNNSVIWIIDAKEGANDVAITLPEVSPLASDTVAYRITLVNYSTFKVAVLAANGSEGIEGNLSYIYHHRYDKQTFVSPPAGQLNWLIE